MGAAISQLEEARSEFTCADWLRPHSIPAVGSEAETVALRCEVLI